MPPGDGPKWSSGLGIRCQLHDDWGWPMVNFYHLLLAVAAYLVLLFLAKQAMLKRGKGFELKTFSLMHNLAMTALSLYMFVQTCRELYIQKYSLWNNPVDPTPAGDGMAHVIYVFYISKFFEFIDSFIIVARFRLRQLAFIHVYHHTSIVFICWAACYFWPGGDSYFVVLLNSFVHVVLYGYYFASSIVEKPQPGARVSWASPYFWRRYITTLQLCQFVAMLGQSLYMLTVKEARYSRKGAAYLGIYMLTMLYVFGSFYKENYKGGKARAKLHEG
ncbi:unnamed protein product (mitochondrion) [Plasmodiophora brassicae]|uniref:Elongation of fatty acids protein n=1 Tax=Plasmodiophora brassicae TaxID=37360 RepID=A0A3P3Y3J6_PLABS|nr:unnamed protein product [Plasmodiophora brassicae]